MLKRTFNFLFGGWNPLLYLLCFLVFEILIRRQEGVQDFFANARQYHFELTTNSCASSYHPQLGWAPDPKKSGRRNILRTKVTILPPGIRANDNPAVSEVPLTLAVGDSFTFGEQVSNHETWPSLLEAKLGTKVVNGGGCAYAMDQVYLRAVQLLQTFKPKQLIVSIDGIELARNRLKTSAAAAASKPYFEIHQDKLVAKNIPVPFKPERQMAGTPFQKAVSYSFLLDRLFNHFAGESWMEPRGMRVSNDETEMDGERIGCLLTRKFKELAQANSVDMLFISQSGHFETMKDFPTAFNAMECARKEGIATLDLEGPLTAIYHANRPLYDELFFAQGHMTRKGNDFIAEKIAEHLKSRQKLAFH